MLDIGLPKLDVYEVAKRIRLEPWGNNAILIAITGWGQDVDRRKSQEAGFDHHLVKPVDARDISALMSAAGTQQQPQRL